MTGASKPARKPASVRLPDEPPTRHVQEPTLSLRAICNDTARPRYMSVGNPKCPGQTIRAVLRATYIRNSRQTLIYAAKRFRVWNDAERVWGVVDDEAIEAFLYRAAADNRWPATPQHVRRLLKVLRLEVFWPPPAMRCGGAA